MSRNELTFVKTIHDIDCYWFKPKIGKWYYTDYAGYKKHSLSHNFRMLLEYLEGGYEILYMYNSSLGGILGYILIARGGRRLRCSTPEDIVLGPIWVKPELRGKGIASKGIFTVLHELDIKYQNAYEYIQPTNLSSIRTVEKNGFSLFGSGSSKGFFKRIYNDGGKEFLIYRYPAIGGKDCNGLDKN